MSALMAWLGLQPGFKNGFMVGFILAHLVASVAVATHYLAGVP